MPRPAEPGRWSVAEPLTADFRQFDRGPDDCGWIGCDGRPPVSRITVVARSAEVQVAPNLEPLDARGSYDLIRGWPAVLLQL